MKPLEGVIIKRQAGHWSAARVKAETYYRPEKAYVKKLGEPNSGWEASWLKLVQAGILDLPDASEVGCNVRGLDGFGFVVETNNENLYRTYMYDPPTFAKCKEAKQMLQMGGIIADEFDLEEF